MANRNPILERIRGICLALPDTKETLTWGEPHFRVHEKIFAGYGQKNDKPVLGFKLEMDHAAGMVRLPGFRPARYVGHKGWVSMDAADIQDWELVEEMILESYQLIAPKRSLARLAGKTLHEPPQKAAKRKKK